MSVSLRVLKESDISSDKKRKGFLQRHLPGSADTDKETTKNISPLSSPQNCSKMGVVVTSARHAHRSESTLDGPRVHLEYFLTELSDDDLSSGSWSSSANAAVAFAVATAGSSNPRDLPQVANDSFRAAARRKMSITSSAATMRVLSVLRHWVTKHSQDFDGNNQLKNLAIEFLEDIVCTPTLLPAEHKAASQLLRMLTKEEPAHKLVDLKELLQPPQKPSKENISTLSALEIAEQMTYFDHKILFAIGSEEFLGQAWMKDSKKDKAPNICLMTERFNEMCRLIVSEIISAPCLTTRVERIEKWAAVADICRCLHNFNGVLQVCAAFTNASVFRLKKTWERVGKTSKGTIDRLHNIASSDGRHRNLRDALHRCDPPCIPYLGIYLSDLTFIDEGTPNFTENGLLNFAKMRMIAHVIREVRNFQQTPYKIDPIPKAANYLLDPNLRLTDDELYQRSLGIEPRAVSRLSVSYTSSSPLTNQLKVHLAQ